MADRYKITRKPDYSELVDALLWTTEAGEILADPVESLILIEAVVDQARVVFREQGISVTADLGIALKRLRSDVVGTLEEYAAEAEG